MEMIMQPQSTAHAVVTNPETFYDQPDILAVAWELLMAERGKRVELDHLGPPAHLIKTHRANIVADDFVDRTPRILARIRRHVAQTSAPQGGDAA